MIFNQWQTGQCEGYAFLAALYILDHTIDYKKIDAELQVEKVDLAYPWRAGKWFLDKWYIKSYEVVEKIQLKALLSRWVPLITGTKSWDFSKVKAPDYILPLSKGNKMFQHKHTLIKEEEKTYLHQNSWWEQWWDKGCFRTRKEDFVLLEAMWRVIPNISDPHNTILKRYMWTRVDYDKAYEYQCVDWIKEYSALRSRSITSFGDAYSLWQSGLGSKWQKVVSSPGNYPSEGDVVCWGPSWGKWFGHIAIANKFCNPLVLRTTDQNAWNWNWNWLGDNAISPFFRSYSGVVGWFKYIG